MLIQICMSYATDVTAPRGIHLQRQTTVGNLVLANRVGDFD
jgi:hypothetical protein